MPEGLLDTVQNIIKTLCGIKYIVILFIVTASDKRTKYRVLHENHHFTITIKTSWRQSLSIVLA